MSGLKLITVLDAIAGISVSGLTIKDINEVTEEWQIRGAVLYPLVDRLINMGTPTRRSFGIGGNEKEDLSYTLHYRLLYAPVGSGRGIKDIYSGLFTLYVTLFNTIINTASVSGAIEVRPKIANASTQVTDPAGNRFYGLDIDFDVLEYFEV